MFESSLTASTLEAIIWASAAANLIFLYSVFHRGRKIDALTDERDSLRHRVGNLETTIERAKTAFANLSQVAFKATFAGIASVIEIAKLKEKARRANKRAGHAEQRAAHFRRKLYRRNHFARPVGAASFGTFLHSLINRPVTGFARGGFVSPTGRVSDPYKELIDRTMLAAVQGRSTLNPFALRRIRSAGDPFLTARVPSKPLSVADLSTMLGGSVQVVALDPDGTQRTLTGEDADKAVASAFQRKHERKDIRPKIREGADYSTIEARILADALQEKIDAAEPRVFQDRKVGFDPALTVGYGRKDACHAEHAPDTGDGGTVLGHEAMVRAQKFDARVEAEACDTQRPSHDRQVPRFQTRPTDPFEYSDRSPRAG